MIRGRLAESSFLASSRPWLNSNGNSCANEPGQGLKPPVHAAGKGDTLSTTLILGGLALYNLSHWSGDALLVSLKIAFIAVFIFMASPTATHAIIDAGYEYGEKPWTRKRKGDAS